MTALGAVGGVGAATAVTAAVVQGQQQKSVQKRAEQRQNAVQREASSRAAAELRRQTQDRAKQNQKRPEIRSLLAREREAASEGIGSTTLTGAGGVERGRLTLGKTSLLGGS